jgi:hypothetical protein
MAHLVPAPWPPPSIGTERLVLREREPRDRQALVDLFTEDERYEEWAAEQWLGV